MLTPARRRLFLAITLLLPLLLLVGVELVLRLAWPQGTNPLFVEAPGTQGRLLTANPRVAARWFPNEQVPPAPPQDPFARAKPARGLRVFVLGESSTAGFPYPRNGTFSRVLRDALRDVLPGDSVEVVNLGIAATNSYALVDIVDDVIAQRPDAVLIYAGHNEYYGALGVGSTAGGASLPPAMVRLYLRLLDLRTASALRAGLVRLRAGDAPTSAEASLMEALARDPSIELGGETYARGVRQFESNLRVLLGRLRDAGVPAFVGSMASNLRDQPPLESPANERVDGADQLFAQAQRALAAGDSTRARELFTRARDRDVVRFRAPGEFTTIVQRVAQETGATYVPAAERFAGASPGGMPGRELFLEHVHPTDHGQALLARAYFDALQAQGFAGRPASLDRLRAWEEYEAAMALTPFDRRIAQHTLGALMTRWPFVPVDAQRDYRGEYAPVDAADSLAFLSSRGGLPWAQAKLQVAELYARRGAADSAIAEYRGLARDAPHFETPQRLYALALAEAGRTAEAEPVLRQALALAPHPATARALAAILVERKDFAEAIPVLEQAVRAAPGDAQTLYQLSLAYGLSRDLPRARAVALRLRSVQPGFPGLDGWLTTLGLTGGGQGASSR